MNMFKNRSAGDSGYGWAEYPRVYWREGATPLQDADGTAIRSREQAGFSPFLCGAARRLLVQTGASRRLGRTLADFSPNQ